MATVARRTPRAASRLLNPGYGSGGALAPQKIPSLLRSEDPVHNDAHSSVPSSASSPSAPNSNSSERSMARIGRFRFSHNLRDLETGNGSHAIVGPWGNGSSCPDRSSKGSFRVPYSGQLSTFGARGYSAMASMEERMLRVGEDEGIMEVEENKGEDERELEKIDAGGDSQALFSPAPSLVDVTGEEVLKYITFSEEDQTKYFGEGLPRAMVKEFEVTKLNSVMIRPRVLHLCNQLQRCVTDNVAFQLPAEYAITAKPRRHFLLDGPTGSGKSVALAMLVQWARAKGWLVFYIPSGKDWTHGSLYYRNEDTGLVDTPVTAQTALEGFLKSHSELLDTLPCRVLDPVPLGEGAGVPRVRGPQEFTLPEGATLKQLVEKGLSMSHAGVGAVVRLRKELSLIKDIPVLIAIDDYNSWFVFSQYGVRAKKPIHAQKLAMVHAFRPMEGSGELMVTAFSHSNAVGKLPVHLPDVPKGVRFDFPRYSPVEANTALQYYHSRAVTSKEPAEADVIRLYYLTNGNGNEIRTLARFV